MKFEGCLREHASVHMTSQSPIFTLFWICSAVNCSIMVTSLVSWLRLSALWTKIRPEWTKERPAAAEDRGTKSEVTGLKPEQSDDNSGFSLSFDHSYNQDIQ